MNNIDRLDEFIRSPAFLSLSIALESAKSGPGTFLGDSMFVWGRNLGFLEDRQLKEAFRQALGTYGDAQTRHVANELIWRKHVLLWCARNALDIPGDFAECGVSVGFGVDVLVNALNFAGIPKNYWLYDTFDGVPAGQADEGSPEKYGHGATTLDQVRAKFEEFPNVKIVPGMLPQSLEGNCPESIALLHVDLNNSSAEIDVLAALLPRVSVGGYVVLDDFGWARFGRQHSTQTKLFQRLGLPVLELPTGQAVIQVNRPVLSVSHDLVEEVRNEEFPAIANWPSKTDTARSWSDVEIADRYYQDQINYAEALINKREDAEARRILESAKSFNVVISGGSASVTWLETSAIDKPHLVRGLQQREIDRMASFIAKLQGR